MSIARNAAVLLLVFESHLNPDAHFFKQWPHSHGAFKVAGFAIFNPFSVMRINVFVYGYEPL